MRSTLARALATASFAVALTVGGLAGTAQAATPKPHQATETNVLTAAAITGVCSIYLYGRYFDGASFVTEGLCRAFANLYANQYPPGAVTYTWYPQA
ncbi:hypothetical protein [Paractinoplanes rishiriensis]|uniref:Uncharacterized protein n=1 Tax=Paractinoplanes rishiriensis TaxID=1050105 RepID=A0A919K1M1_9ACTN|nr:hypothetical protein [Actinoplanes rishiriensis]GIE97562.1 hypothetical protein Ari01nite_50270 [Actinoplanes rishiriensis]